MEVYNFLDQIKTFREKDLENSSKFNFSFEVVFFIQLSYASFKPFNYV